MASPEGSGAATKVEKHEQVYVFKPGPYVIYPKDGWKGTLTSDVEAVKTGGKTKGLTGYRSLTEIHLFHRGADGEPHYWQRSIGTYFGAYAKKSQLKR
ncbi:MAG: hypothetical protein WC741_00520 [Patescibacteria group bacterium]|jgi:hypothetical protein